MTKLRRWSRGLTKYRRYWEGLLFPLQPSTPISSSVMKRHDEIAPLEQRDTGHDSNLPKQNPACSGETRGIPHSNIGAEDGIRTRTGLPPSVFKTEASAVPPLRRVSLLYHGSYGFAKYKSSEGAGGAQPVIRRSHPSYSGSGTARQREITPRSGAKKKAKRKINVAVNTIAAPEAIFR